MLTCCGLAVIVGSLRVQLILELAGRCEPQARDASR